MDKHYSNNFQEQINDRNIPIEWVESTLNSPQKTFTDSSLKVYQSTISDASSDIPFCLNVYVDEQSDLAVVVTAFKSYEDE